jgi:hypothetical protein
MDANRYFRARFIKFIEQYNAKAAAIGLTGFPDMIQLVDFMHLDELHLESSRVGLAIMERRNAAQKTLNAIRVEFHYRVTADTKRLEYNKVDENNEPWLSPQTAFGLLLIRFEKDYREFLAKIKRAWDVYKHERTAYDVWYRELGSCLM